jgi:hypothetical protein
MQSRTVTITNSESKRSNDLMYYIMTNNLSKIKELNLVTKFNVDNIIDSTNQATALHYSLQLQDHAITNYLLNLNADPYKKNGIGKNAFQISLDYHKSCVFDHIIREKDIVISDLNDDCIQLKKKLKLESDSKEYLSKSIDSYRYKINNLDIEIKTLNDQNNILKIENNEIKDNNKNLKRKIDRLNESIDGFLNSNKK